MSFNSLLQTTVEQIQRFFREDIKHNIFKHISFIYYFAVYFPPILHLSLLQI